MHRQDVFTSDYFAQQPIIQSIRIAILDTQQTQYDSVFVSSVFSQPGSFVVQLESSTGHLLTFVYTGSLWIHARSSTAFGFLKLRQAPEETFKYLNTHWTLSQHCYTLPKKRKGIHTLYVQGWKLPQAEILQLRTGGEIETNQTVESNSVVLNLGRSVTATTGYYQAPENTQYYIGSVNGYSKSKLQLKSSDSTIEIEGPSPVSDNISDSIYVLRINTKKGFPVCPQWSDSY